MSEDIIDKIPGLQNNRKTPLGELNWIFTAITDTIAWNVLPRPLFSATLSTGFIAGKFVPQLLIGGANNARERLYSSFHY